MKGVNCQPVLNNVLILLVLSSTTGFWCKVICLVMIINMIYDVRLHVTVYMYVFTVFV